MSAMKGKPARGPQSSVIPPNGKRAAGEEKVLECADLSAWASEYLSHGRCVM